jgi:hypothetical protein
MHVMNGLREDKAAVDFIDSLLKSATGKTQRFMLRAAAPPAGNPGQ